MLYKDQTFYPAPELLLAVLRHIEAHLDMLLPTGADEPEQPNPFRNEGGEFICDAFTVRAFDWDWAHEDWNTRRPAPVNLQWRDVEVYWAKHAQRGVQTNRPVSNDEIATMCEECIAALDEMMKEEMRP